MNALVTGKQLAVIAAVAATLLVVLPTAVVVTAVRRHRRRKTATPGTDAGLEILQHRRVGTSGAVIDTRTGKPRK